MAVSVGGTNASIISWGQVVMSKDEVGSPEYQKEFIAFWPGGGGALETKSILKKITPS